MPIYEYQCQHLTTLKINTVHISRLKPYLEDMVLSNEQVASNDSIDDFVIEKIIDHVLLGADDCDFRVRWEGYTEEDDLWIPWKELKDTAPMTVYLQKHPELAEIFKA